MPPHRYVNPNNLFDDNDLNDAIRSNCRRRNSSGGPIAILERQRQLMLKKQQEIQQQTLASTTRSLQLLRDSEDIGIAAAKELVRQHEALDNTNRHLDAINNNLRCTQKHINGIQSIFYGIKSYLSGNPKQNSALKQTSLNHKSPEEKCNKMKHGLDTFENVLEKRGNTYDSHRSTRLRGNTDTVEELTRDGQQVHVLIDQNLGEMVQAVTRLKLFGIALGNEIDQQIKVVDTIQDKVRHADIKIYMQDKEMRKINGK